MNYKITLVESEEGFAVWYNRDSGRSLGLMPRLPGVSQKAAERALAKIGFEVIRQGKHATMRMVLE